MAVILSQTEFYNQLEKLRAEITKLKKENTAQSEQISNQFSELTRLRVFERIAINNPRKGEVVVDSLINQVYAKLVGTIYSDKNGMLHYIETGANLNHSDLQSLEDMTDLKQIGVVW